MGTLTYTSNNSGGGWWLSDDEWKALEAEGWNVKWIKDDPDYSKYGLQDGRWLGALAKEASKQFGEPMSGVEEWQRITGQDASDEGCNCCGTPHNFEWDGPDGTHQYMTLNRGPATISFA